MRQFRSTFCMFLAVLGLPAGGPDDRDIARLLVKKLGDDTPSVRDAAEKELLRLGEPALSAVRDGLRSPDAEIRRRCERLVVQIVKAEWKRKAAAYAADVNGAKRHDLPLLDEYEKLVGKTPSARKLFAACVEPNGAFLQSVAADRELGRTLYRARCAELYVPPKPQVAPPQVSAGDLASLLLASKVLRDDISDWNKPGAVAFLFANPAFRNAVQDRECGEAFRKLLIAWAETATESDPVAQQHFLFLVNAADLKEALPIVRRMMRDKNAPTINIRPTAVAVLAKVGGKQVAAELEKMWNDNSVLVNRMEGGGNMLLGDQALAASIGAAGKKPEDYGIAGSHSLLLKIAGTNGWQISFYWFPSDDARRDGLEKWRKEANKGR